MCVPHYKAEIGASPLIVIFCNGILCHIHIAMYIYSFPAVHVYSFPYCIMVFIIVIYSDSRAIDPYLHFLFMYV